MDKRQGMFFPRAIFNIERFEDKGPAFCLGTEYNVISTIVITETACPGTFPVLVFAVC